MGGVSDRSRPAPMVGWSGQSANLPRAGIEASHPSPMGFVAAMSSSIWVLILVWVVGIPAAVIAGVFLYRAWRKRRSVPVHGGSPVARLRPIGRLPHEAEGGAVDRGADARGAAIGAGRPPAGRPRWRPSRLISTRRSDPRRPCPGPPADSPLDFARAFVGVS